MAREKKNQSPALLDSDVHSAFMKIKEKGSLSSISAAMRQVLKDNKELKRQLKLYTYSNNEKG